MADFIDEFYKVENGKVVTTYMTYRQYWNRKASLKAVNLFNTYEEASKVLRRN